MKMKAKFSRKENEFTLTDCEIAKVVELPIDAYTVFRNNMMRDRDFIAEFSDSPDSGYKDGVIHCLMVLGEGCDDGVLVNPESASYARYSAFIPNARQVLNSQPRFQCVSDLEKNLSNAVDEVISCVNNYDGDTPYRCLVSDLMEEHHFDETYLSLFVQMLNECEQDGVLEIEMINDEIFVYSERHLRQEETLAKPAILPFEPERMEHLLDKALDWIGKNGEGAELYDTLKNEVGMSNDEITAAGFDMLQDYYEDPVEEELPGMIME